MTLIVIEIAVRYVAYISFNFKFQLHYSLLQAKFHK